MAWDSAEIPAAELAYAAADKPILVGRNWLRESAVATRWNQTGSFADADESDSDGPAARGHDEYDHLQTYPDSSQTNWYYLMDLGAEREIDTVAILNPSNTSGVTIRVQIADNNTFTTRASTLKLDTPTDNNRLIYLTLSHSGATARRYTLTRYVRIYFTKGAGFIPKMGEVIVGRRLQLPYKPTRPFDPNRLVSDIARFQSVSGIQSTYVRSKGRSKLAATLEQDDATQIADFETFWEEHIDFGTQPYLWIPDPNTTPSAAYWMLETSPELSGPFSDPVRRDFVLNALEQGPNYYKLES